MSEDDFHKSIAKPKSSILIVWIVPVIALIIAGSMITKYIIQKGEDIVIVFESAEGFTSGKTPLKYKGIGIGTVSDMRVNPQNKSEFFVTVTVDNDAIPLVARKGTKFWKVEPKVSLGEVSGLNTIISGSYIEMLPGDGEYKAIQKRDFFLAEPHKPIESYRDGILINLSSNQGDLVEGTPLLYGKFAVGKVVQRELRGGKFYYKVFVKQRYAELIKERSHFWRLSGVEVEASLSGVKLSMGPLSSVITGGIMFDTPSGSPALADTAKQFHLCQSKDSCRLNGKRVTLTSSRDTELDPNLSKIYYRGSQAGKIVHINFDQKSGRNRIVVELFEEYEHLLKYESYFWYVKPKIGLSGVSGLDALARGNYIAFDTTMKESQGKKLYQLYDRKPQTDGKFYTLQTDQLGSLSSGDTIYYKNIPAGEISSYRYDAYKDRVTMRLFIRKNFTHLINQSTRFFRHSGIEFALNREGMHLRTDALDSVVHGGIGFVVNDKRAAKVDTSHIFSLYDNSLQANANSVRVTLEMHRGHKLHKGSRVLYKDLKIGSVEDISLDPNGTVLAQLAIDQDFAYLLKTDSIFWIEDFKATVRGIKNSTAALFGPSIALKPGQNKAVGSHFVLSSKKPFFTVPKEGLRIVLNGSRKSSLRAGSPVLYRQHKIGVVEHYDLTPDGSSVQIGLFIEKQYAHMVRKNAKFYHLSAIGMKVDLTGIKVMTETLESMIYGGVGMAIPDEPEAKATEGERFILELGADDDWFEWEPKLKP